MAQLGEVQILSGGFLGVAISSLLASSFIRYRWLFVNGISIESNPSNSHEQ